MNYIVHIACRPPFESSLYCLQSLRACGLDRNVCDDRVVCAAFKAYVGQPSSGGCAEQKKTPGVANKLTAKLGSS